MAQAVVYRFADKREERIEKREKREEEEMAHFG
jgi:hypothetical protein